MTNNNTHDYVSMLDSKRNYKNLRSTSKGRDPLPPAFKKVPTMAEEQSDSLMAGYILNVFTVGGYGFVRGEDGKDYFFRIEKFHGLKKGTFPEQGRYVRFLPEAVEKRQFGKAPRIVRISYDQERLCENVDPGTDSGRVKCLHCGKMMVPRMMRQNGVLLGTFCPFCMELYKSNSESETPMLTEEEESRQNFMIHMTVIAFIFFFIWVFCG